MILDYNNNKKKPLYFSKGKDISTVIILGITDGKDQKDLSSLPIICLICRLHQAHNKATVDQIIRADASVLKAAV